MKYPSYLFFIRTLLIYCIPLWYFSDWFIDTCGLKIFNHGEHRRSQSFHGVVSVNSFPCPPCNLWLNVINCVCSLVLR